MLFELRFVRLGDYRILITIILNPDIIQSNKS
jgi:hypothetical protein